MKNSPFVDANFILLLATVCLAPNLTAFAQEQGSAKTPPSRILEWGDNRPNDEWWFKETVNPMTDRKSWVVAYVIGGSPRTHEAQFYCDDEEWTSFHLFGPAMNLPTGQKKH
jgi:hypothetical protein